MRRILPRIPFQRIPVRWRIAAATAGLTLLILVCFALVLGNVVGHRIQGDFDDELTNAARALASETRVSSDSVLGTVVSSPQLPDSAMAGHAVIRVVDQFGTPLAATDRSAELGPPRSGRVHEVGDLKVATEPITAADSLPAYVQYARPDHGVEATVGRLWLFLGAGVLGGTLLALLAGLAIANRAMRPIASLTALARDIASTRDPSRRMPVPETDDEVGELARTMDGMLEALDEARSEREQALERQREFVADASHELRTPLTSIQANLELLQAANGEAAADQTVDSALSSTKRMSRLVSDLLLLARADAGRRVARTDVDLAAIASGALEEVAPLAGGRTIEGETGAPLPLRGNPDELHRLVRNLLENAVRHTPEDATIKLRTARDGDQALLEVSDDGPGIPDGMEQQIFDRFVRGHGPADTAAGGGSGLGLAIVRAVAESHGGSVEAGRSSSGGALFTVRLPFEPSRERETEPASL